MPNFYYSPGASDQRGQYLSAGMADAGRNLAAGMQSLAAGIAQAEQNHKENKAYASLAETLGLDPKHSTKQDVQAAILKSSIVQGMQDRKSHDQARAAMGRFMQVFSAARSGGPDYAATLAQGRGPLANPVMAPPAGVGDALAKAFASNPALFNDDKTAAMANTLARTLMAGGDSGITIDPTTGIPVMRSGNSVRPINPAWLPGGRPGTPKGLSTLDIPGVGNVFFNGPRQINPKMATGGPQAGRFPAGAKLVKMDGKDVALYPDGTWTPVPNAPANNQDELDIMNQARQNAAGGASNEPTPPYNEGLDENGTESQPLALPESEHDLETGKVYDTAHGPATWNGTNFVTGGANWNPVNQ